jgi:hypothetical protein
MCLKSLRRFIVFQQEPTPALPFPSHAWLDFRCPIWLTKHPKTGLVFEDEELFSFFVDLLVIFTASWPRPDREVCCACP